MVKLSLSIKAELTNVTDLVPASDTFDYNFKVQCTSCREIHENLVTLSQTSEKSTRSGKGTDADFVWKCSFCKRESSASFEANTSPLPYKAEDSDAVRFSTLITFDCRGLEFVDFDPVGPWKCVGVESGTVFELSGEDMKSEDGWRDYDEKASEEVCILEFESKWSKK